MSDASSTSDTDKSELIERNWLPFVIGAVAIVAIIGALLLLQPERTGVPDVVGMTAEDAEQAIIDAGFVLGSVETSAVMDAEKGIVLEQDPEAGVDTAEGSEINLVISAAATLEMPDVTGMTEDEATAALEDEGFVVQTANYYVDDVETGLVAGQLPNAGETVEPGSQVGILVSLGKAPEETVMVKVPDVTGQTEKDAVSAITAVGLTVRIYYDTNDTVPQGDVIDQEPVGGSEIAISSSVIILVSQGTQPKPPAPTTIQVPEVGGMTEANAKKALSDAGLKAESTSVYSDTVVSGSVVGQFPSAGTSVLAGSAVGIAVSQGQPASDAIEVSDFIGMSSADAVAAIEAIGLKPIALESTTPDGQAEGTVFAQLPEAGAKVERGSPVLILVANGDRGEVDPVQLPEMLPEMIE